MGVFKWLRRERVTITTRHDVEPEPTPVPEAQDPQDTTAKAGTIRTEEYKRDLAEFQARRSIGNKELQVTPVKKKCGRHSLPISCTDCAAEHDNTFNYEKKSAVKYKKKTHKRVRSATSSDRLNDGLPNIQFLFQNQVFMPGNIFETASYSEPQKSKRLTRHRVIRSPEADFLVRQHIDFKEEEEQFEPPEFFRNNSLPYDIKTFLSPKIEDDVDGLRAAGDLRLSSHNSSVKDDSDDKLWEVMSELKNLDQWADEQLQPRTPNRTVSDDSKSDTSAYGLPIASSSNVDVATEKDKVWSLGKWGVVPVQIKRLHGVTIQHVKKKRNVEVNILRKCRHPNIILLMGLYTGIHDNIQLICERCLDTLYGILHVQGRILSAQTSVQYALDIANALVFLQMQGYIHTGLNSTSIMITAQGTAKLADLGPCTKLPKPKEHNEKSLDLYSSEPHYVNIEATREQNVDCEPLLSTRSSETYLISNAVAKPYAEYRTSQHYRWHAPELFAIEEEEVFPCAKSDVYSLCLVLWECCNAQIPWKSLSYEKLKELYTLWKTGIRLPQDGTYPGSLLSLLQNGLKLQRSERMDLVTLQETLQTVKSNLEELEYIIISARLSKKKSTFSSVAWDTTSPTDSDCLSPRNIEHQAIIHNEKDSTTSSDNYASPIYHTIRKTKTETRQIPEKCIVSNEQDRPVLKYEHLPDKDYNSSACSTPIAKLRARINNLGTPGALHRSDSTEYCSILSPNNFAVNDSKCTEERPTAKLSRSFTPQSYKPLHIKVPEFNLDDVKTLLKDQNESGRSSYNFDIKNYSLPTTPIARSNKLRRNAWLSGDVSTTERSTEKLRDDSRKSNNEEFNNNQSSRESSILSNKNCFKEKSIQEDVESVCSQNMKFSTKSCSPESDIHHSATNYSRESVDAIQNGVRHSSERTELQDNGRLCSPEMVTRQENFADFKRLSSQSSAESPGRERSNSWSYKSSELANRWRLQDEALAGLSVKPLVAIHEKWILEANRKTGRSFSLPEDSKNQLSAAVKPASHCVRAQQSLPALAGRAHGSQWEQFCQNREAIAKSINFSERGRDRTRQKSFDKCTSSEDVTITTSKTDQATDTRSIEEFIRELIRKEFQHLLHEISEDSCTCDDILNKGVSNIVESLKNDEEGKKETVKSFSRVKINGNNKPLLQITFSRTGENSLQVLDNCVNVMISESSPARDKNPADDEPTLLKRCQAFNAIQEARSTEDLYIDDDLSTHLQENFGGKVKLIPLHGSLHEILCEREDDCCLIKVKQENGCDTIYFRCDNSDTESRDAVDAPRDTLLLARTRTLARRETVCRVGRPRPKSEIFTPTLKETRILSNSSPSLITRDEEIEVNIENVMSYQDSSSEECIKCQIENDDFEMLEKKIEEDLANSTMSSLTCGCLEKISEENLSVINEDATERNDY